MVPSRSPVQSYSASRRINKYSKNVCHTYHPKQTGGRGGGLSKLAERQKGSEEARPMHSVERASCFTTILSIKTFSIYDGLVMSGIQAR